MAQSISALHSDKIVEMAETFPEEFPVGSQTELALNGSHGLGGRRLYTREQWEARKNIIKQLYSHENKPFKRVIDILRTEHNFYPTRRQFYRKISEWGLEKNIKDKEKQGIIQDLGSRHGDEDLTAELRGRLIDPATIQRWQKRHWKVKNVVRLFPNNYSASAQMHDLSKGAYEVGSTAESWDTTALPRSGEITELSRMTDDCMREEFDHWSLVDVPGSPLLSRLFEALNIEVERDIPSIDLAASNTGIGISPIAEAEKIEYFGTEGWTDVNPEPGSRDLARYSQEVLQQPGTFSAEADGKLVELSFSEWSFREWDFSTGQPFKTRMIYMLGLSPFIISSNSSRYKAPFYTTLSPFARSQYFQTEETNWKRVLRRNKSVLGVEDPRILEAMEKLATTHFHQHKFKEGERLFRKLAISYEKSLGVEHRYTLRVYLKVVQCLSDNGSRLKVYNIHCRIHNIITRNFPPNDLITLGSSSVRTQMLYQFGQIKEVEELSRQTFQIALSTRGPKCSATLRDMKRFAITLRRCDRLAESEKLLRLNMQLLYQVEGRDSEMFLKTILQLIGVLLSQERYEECRDLTTMLAEKLAVKLGDEHYLTLNAYHNLAVCMRMQRNMPECERLLRIVLEKNIVFYGEGDPDTFLYSLKLSEALCEMGRHTEALAVVEKKYKALAKACGSSHSRTLSYGRRIARCYEVLGRHKEAISFLTNSINYARKSGDKLTKGLLKSVLSLGDVFRHTDRFAETVTCYEECLKSAGEIDCLSQRVALIIVRKLGCCYEDLERYDEALALYERTLDQTNSTYRDDHPSTREVLIQMDELRDFLDARDEMTWKKYCELGRIESLGPEEMLRKDEPMSMEDVLRNSNATENEEEWMQEMFDFDLLAASPSTSIDLGMDAPIPGS